MANLIAKLSRATPSLVWNHWKFLKRQEELRQRSLRLAQRLASQQAGLQITAGPFEGMKYLEQVAGSALLPKLIGSYESELHAALLDMTRRGHRLIIDVGCAEGYYAVGMARLMPQVRVRAHDTDPKARRLCNRLAHLNGVADRVAVGGYFTTGELATIRDLPALIICDCEGYEAKLLDPKVAPVLAECDVIVEVHDHIVPGVGELLDKSFAPTHDIEVIKAEVHWPQDWADQLEGLSPDEQAFALNEYRVPNMTWRVYRRKG
jgi:hypothetical protein